MLLIDILEVKYNFIKKSELSDSVVSVKVSRRLADVTDTIKQLVLDVKQLQSTDILVTDVISRMEFSVGSFGMRVKNWKVKENTATGSVGHLYSTGFVPPVAPFHLASGTNQEVLAGVPLGSAFGPLITVRSGGTF